MWNSSARKFSLCQTLEHNPFKLDPAPCHPPSRLQGVPWVNITLSDLQYDAGNLQLPLNKMTAISQFFPSGQINNIPAFV